jgi:hypothetical protein
MLGTSNCSMCGAAAALPITTTTAKVDNEGDETNAET